MLEDEFCIDALNEAIHKFGPPGIMNTDQGLQGGFKRSLQRLRSHPLCHAIACGHSNADEAQICIHPLNSDHPSAFHSPPKQ